MKRIDNMEELRMAQIELRHKSAMKELELKAHANALKEMLNPLTYINYALSKVAIVEQLAASFMKGYTTVKEIVRKYRDNNRTGTPPAQQTDGTTPDNQ